MCLNLSFIQTTAYTFLDSVAYLLHDNQHLSCEAVFTCVICMYGGIGASGEIFCGRTTRPGNKAFRVPACRTCEEYQMIGLQEEKEGFPHGHLEMTLLKDCRGLLCILYPGYLPTFLL